ncbi:MAG: glycosyltransferase [Candidatus Nanopelagicales bacterium]
MKIYLVTAGSRGDFEPFYAFAKKATELGNEVYLSVTQEFFPKIANENFTALPLPGSIQYFVDKNGVSIIKNSLDFLPNVRPFIVKLLDTSAEQILKVKPDVVLYHPTVLTAPIAARSVGAVSGLVEIIPVLTPTKEFASAGLWTSNLGFLNKFTYKAVILAEKLFYLETRKWSKKLGIKNIKPDFSLSLTSPAVLKRPSDWPDNTYLVGPWHEPDTEEVDQIVLDFVNRKDTVYAGFGSMKKGNPQKITAEIIKGVKKLNMQVLVSTGWGGLAVSQDFVNDPDVMFVKSVSHTKIFPLVKVILHHGGIGTTHAALRAGTPSVIVPFIVDQPWWAHKLHKQELGPKSLPLRKLKSEKVSQRILQALKYQNNVFNVAQDMKLDNGVVETIKILQKYLSSKH